MNLIILPKMTKEARHLPRYALEQMGQCLDTIRAAESMSDIPNMRALKGFPNRYRIRFGDYRLGLLWNGASFIADHVAPRGGFYKKYP